jgi:hypothetical protein
MTHGTTPQDVNKHVSLTDIKEGMDVHDSAGDKVGTVASVMFGEGYNDDFGAEGVVIVNNTAFNDSQPRAAVVRTNAEVEDSMPDSLRGRLQQYGYIIVDTGLLKNNRYAAADQISSVSGGRVNLSVHKDELLKE